jgi:hypothetical protein
MITSATSAGTAVKEKSKKTASGQAAASVVRITERSKQVTGEK